MYTPEFLRSQDHSFPFYSPLSDLIHANGNNTYWCFFPPVFLWLPVISLLSTFSSTWPLFPLENWGLPEVRAITVFPTTSSTGLSVTVSSIVLFPKLQIYISHCLWTSPLGALNMLKIEFIIFQSPKRNTSCVFLPEWIENILYQLHKPNAETHP